jgi:hypothetical protein
VSTQATAADANADANVFNLLDNFWKPFMFQLFSGMLFSSKDNKLLMSSLPLSRFIERTLDYCRYFLSVLDEVTIDLMSKAANDDDHENEKIQISRFKKEIIKVSLLSLDKSIDEFKQSNKK